MSDAENTDHTGEQIAENTAKEVVSDTQTANEATAILKRINRTEASVEQTVKKIDTHFQTALSHAAVASTKASEATSSANTAKTRAGESSNSAITSKSNADNSANDADTTKRNASEASNDADTTKTKANDATESLKLIKTKENEAISSASIAKTKDDEATGSAQRAKHSEEMANSSATTSEEKLKTIIANAETAREKTEETIASAANTKIKEDEIITRSENAKTKEDKATNSASIAETKQKEAAESAKEAERSAKEAATAHNLSTTAGLAGAFNEKGNAALNRMYYASVSLVIALVAIGFIGYLRFDKVVTIISTLVDSNSDRLLEAILAQILFFLIGAAAPIWLAWMSTRMISRYFQLSEDYSYKTSLAKAYVGFKEQADGLDPIFEERLFAAAITQLDSNPLRFSEHSSHPDSPLQDLLQQPFMISTMKTNMGFKDSMSGWMNRRFKTNFRIEQIDLLNVAVPGATETISKAAADV